MKILWVVVCVICLAVGWLSVPRSSPAVDTSLLCPGMADSIWDQWHKGMLPKNADTIIKVLKVASDCPKLAGSMEKIAYDIKAFQEKKEHAGTRVKKRVEAPATIRCPPAMDWMGPGPGC